MQVKQFEREFGWITGNVCVLTTAKVNLQERIWGRGGEEAGLEEAWDQFWNNTSFWDKWVSLLWFELRFQSPERRSYNLLLHQCLWYKMQLVVNLSLRGILEFSDATVTFVTGAMEAQNISENIVVSLNRCCGYMDYTRTVLLELKVLHASFCSRYEVQAVCVKGSHRRIMSTDH